MKYLFTASNIVNRFIDFKKFPQNLKFEYQTINDLIQLDTATSYSQVLNLQRTVNTLNTNWFHSDIHSMVSDTYSVGNTQNTNINYDALKDAELSSGTNMPVFLIQISFVQMSTQVNYTYKRFSFMNIVTAVGSIFLC